VINLTTKLFEFFSLYQYACYKQYTDIYGDSPPEEGEGPFNIMWDKEAIMKNEEKGFFQSIVSFSNLGKAPQVALHFVFLTALFERNQFIAFGRDLCYDLYYGINNDNGKVVIIDPIDLTGTYVAKDPEAFLDVLRYYYQYSILNQIGNEPNVLRYYKNLCVDLAGGKDYEYYYNVIFPSEEIVFDTRLSFTNF
jgi:hypothetical protein